jgi:hypothetical protein
MPAHCSSDEEERKRERASIKEWDIEWRHPHQDRGATPLVAAAKYGHAKCVQALLDKGAQIEARDNNGKRGLMWAASGGHVAALGVLLRARAKVRTVPTSLRVELFSFVCSLTDTQARGHCTHLCFLQLFKIRYMFSYLYSLLSSP